MRASMRRVRLAALAVLWAALTVWAVAPARASTTQEAMFQDDTEIVYKPAGQVANTMDVLRSLGVDRVRVSVYWRLVAPNPSSNTKPRFSGGGEDDPTAYPDDNWKRYDTIVKLAQERGLKLNFNVDGPAPDWAVRSTSNSAFADHYYPSASDFGKFVAAVAKRYDGSFTVRGAGGTPAPGGGTGAGGTVPGGATGETLPGVHYWSFMNEPNQSFFLAPQWGMVRGVRREISPVLYRRLVDAGYAALQRTGHASDTVLIGEVAPKGSSAHNPASGMKPLRFIRRLYCVSDRLRPLSGSTATAYGCPASGARSAFPRAHPGLFRATGFGFHPYSLITPPRVRSTDRDFVGIADIPRLQLTLGTIFRAYNQSRTGLPLYSTEFGYQSRPPDPFGFPPSIQAAYDNQSEFITYENPAVRSTDQFLLLDAAPVTQFPRGSYLYWSSFQTGLMTLQGGRKPAFAAYRIPLFIPNSRRRSAGSFRIWGAARPAPSGPARVAIQFRAVRQSSFRTVKSVVSDNVRHYIDTRLRLPLSGQVRLAWTSPGGRTFYSRRASVRIG